MILPYAESMTAREILARIESLREAAGEVLTEYEQTRSLLLRLGDAVTEDEFHMLKRVTERSLAAGRAMHDEADALRPIMNEKARREDPADCDARTDAAD